MDNQAMLTLALGSVVEAGPKVMDVYARDFEVAYKADESPLTEADTLAHTIIVQHLAETGLPVLSEESKAVPYAERSQWDRFWLVDPIDGTKEFIKKNGEFTINIALIDGGCPVMGVVYAPALGTLYCGWTDGESGTTHAWKVNACAGKSVDELIASAEPLIIPVLSASADQPLRVVASRSHCGEETIRFIEQLEAAFGPAERVSKGSSLKLCMVAEGSADIYPRIAPTMEWDTAAAQAVVEAAGGRVLQYDSALSATSYLSEQAAPLRYNKENLLNPYFIVVGAAEPAG